MATRSKKGVPAPGASYVQVTPEQAKEWLGKNKKNRTIRKPVVTGYARDMKRGDWMQAGDPIRFDTEGNLIDGQHRLLAIMLSGVTLPLLVVTGLVPETQDVIDSGLKRTAADQLMLKGYAHATTLAAVAALSMTLESDHAHARPGYTHTEILSWVEDHPTMQQFASSGRSLATHILASPSVLAYCRWQTAERDEVQSQDFFEALTRSRSEGKGDPRSALLRRLQRADQRQENWGRIAYVSIILRAWNYWRDDQRINSIQFASREGIIPIPRQLR